jgi:hypothetical protein
MTDPSIEGPRGAFVYQEALRGLLLQQGAVESPAQPGRDLVFAASFAGSLLGSRALADGLQGWDWTAIVLLLIGGLTVVLLWPYYNLAFRFDPRICSNATSMPSSPHRCRTCTASSRCGSRPTSHATTASSGGYERRSRSRWCSFSPRLWPGCFDRGV